MPMNAAERKRKSRLKKKNENQEEVKEKKKMEMRRYRQNQRKKESCLPAFEKNRILKQRRKNERERKRKQRTKSTQGRIELDVTFLSRYSSGAARAKAVRKAKRALPTTPRKQKEVIKRLADEYEVFEDRTEKERRCVNGIEKDVVQRVLQFFDSSLIGHSTPGRKDCIILRDENGQKTKLQKRYLKYKLSECYEMFKQAHTNDKIGFSKFCGLRPPYVMTSRITPLTSCLCILHENFRLMVSALSTLDVDRFCHLSNEKRERCVCDLTESKCWLQDCKNCNNGKGLKNLWQYVEEEEWDIQNIEYMVWKQDGAGYLKKTVENCHPNDLITKAVKMSGSFLKHCFVNKKQAEAFMNDKAEATSNDVIAVLQIDFAENFCCVPQDEVQSSYWSRTQITLFTAVVWHKGVAKSICISSDAKDHSKNEIFVFLKHIMQNLPNEVKFLKVWSDGPSSQFRNRYTGVTMKELSDYFNIRIEWNFFCAGHGKGAVDGVGGAVKRSVYDLVKSRRAEVNNLDSFNTAFKMVQSKIEMMCVTASDVTGELLQLDMTSKFFLAEPLLGIMSSHQIALENNHPTLFPLSARQQLCFNKGERGGKVGSWVAVIYDDTFEIGQITKLIGPSIEVNFMRSCGANRYQWPEQKDTDRINFATILCQICPPDLHSGAGRILYTLPVKEYQRIVDLFVQNM